MGLKEKLGFGIRTSYNNVDPLFGGLIPRRIIPDAPIEQPTVNTPDIINRGALNPANANGLQSKLAGWNQPQNDQPMNVRFVADPTEQLNLERKKLDLEREKFGYGQRKDAAELELKGAEQKTREQQLDINHRKQALDEWQARNPKGEIKVDKDGKIHVINPINGDTIDTGLTSGDVSDQEKHKWKMQEDEYVQNRIDKRNEYNQGEINKRAKDNNIKGISPTQQRAAEHDVAAELLSNKYSGLEPLTGFASDGTLVIKNPKNDPKIAKAITDFQSEVKTGAEERIKKYTMQEDEPMVDMVDPNGNELLVPASRVEYAKSHGAYEVGASEPLKKKTDDSLNDIEIIKDKSGKVIGANNRKK